MTQQKSPSQYVLLGEIAGAHGIRGQVQVKTYTAEPEAIGSYGPLVDEAGARPLTLTVERVTAKGVIGRVAGVEDRTAAEKLRGRKLFVARAQLPAATEGEFYHVDLIGLSAFDEAGAAIGKVAQVANYGASDILEIRREGSRETVLVPFTEAFIRGVDLDQGRIVVALPEESGEEDEGGGEGEETEESDES